MYGGVRGKATVRLALVGVFASVLAAPALAADLGGNCCADLEERIADLEATTARKGNRKVSLTVSGWVNEAVFAWDDGTERNVYVGTNTIEQSRFRFIGEAKIDKDWSAGYILEIGVQGAPSNQWNQNSDNSINLNPSNQNNALLIRKSNWYIKSQKLGQIAVGLNGTATYHLLDDADPTLTRNVDDAEGAAIYQSVFELRHNGLPIAAPVGGAKLRWTDALRGFNNSTPGDSGRRDVIRYDSPTFAGFVATAAWGEDDLWDVALTYKGDIGDFSVLARAGYGESTDPGVTIPSGASSYVIGGTTCNSSTSSTASQQDFKCSWEGAGATVIHKPTGLFLFGGWGRQEVEGGNVLTQSELFDRDSTVWFLQPGIEKKWFSLGKTNIFGEYRHDDAGSNPGKTVSASIDFWQAGIIQEIEAASASLYLVYQHAGGDVTPISSAKAGPPVSVTQGPKTSLDAFQELIVGTKINF